MSTCLSERPCRAALAGQVIDAEKDELVCNLPGVPSPERFSALSNKL